MNPQAAQVWNFALAKMAEAGKHIETEHDEQAKTEIAKAVYVGAGVLLYLLGECPQERAAHEAAQEFISDMASQECSAAQAYVAAQKILGMIAGLSPPEDPLPAP